MNKLNQENQWVWVVVQDPGENEQILGQYDEERDVSFIPAFLEKEEAREGLRQLVKDREKKYEVQAILYDDLAGRAAEKGFIILMLNGAGKVLEKSKP